MSTAVVRLIMTIVGTGLSVAGSIITARNNDIKMKEFISKETAEKVAEAFKNHSKGS